MAAVHDMYGLYLDSILADIDWGGTEEEIATAVERAYTNANTKTWE